MKHRLDRGGCSDVRVGVGFVGAALGRTCWRRDMVAPVAAAVIRDSVYGFAIWSGGAEICFIPARQGGRLNTRDALKGYQLENLAQQNLSDVDSQVRLSKTWWTTGRPPSSDLR